jgi:hypothetical protein
MKLHIKGTAAGYPVDLEVSVIDIPPMVTNIVTAVLEDATEEVVRKKKKK